MKQIIETISRGGQQHRILVRSVESETPADDQPEMYQAWTGPEEDNRVNTRLGTPILDENRKPMLFTSIEEAIFEGTLLLSRRYMR